MNQIIQLPIPFSCGLELLVDNLTFLPSLTFKNILKTVISSYDKINTMYFHINLMMIITTIYLGTHANSSSDHRVQFFV